MPTALVAKVFDTQANQQFEATFERFPVRIGRNQLNDLQIDRPYVSQFHAAIDLRGRDVFVRDLDLNARIGVYQREKNDRQRIRVNVDLAVEEAKPGMRIFSKNAARASSCWSGGESRDGVRRGG